MPTSLRPALERVGSARDLGADATVLADAAVFVEWPGSLPEEGDAHVLHYWGPWDKLVAKLSPPFRASGAGHQYLPGPTERELLRHAGELFDEIERLFGKIRMRVKGI